MSIHPSNPGCYASIFFMLWWSSLGLSGCHRGGERGILPSIIQHVAREGHRVCSQVSKAVSSCQEGAVRKAGWGATCSSARRFMSRSARA